MTLSTEATPTATTGRNPEPGSADGPRAAAGPTAEAPVDLVEEDLLVEDVSIDGMCGVY